MHKDTTWLAAACLWSFIYLFICLHFSRHLKQHGGVSNQTVLLCPCALRPSAVWRSISQTVPRRVAVIADWETQNPAARPAPPSLFPSASPRRSTMSKHRLTAAPRETGTQTLNPVSVFYMYFQAEGKSVVSHFYCFLFFFLWILTLSVYKCNLQEAICVFRQ